MSSVGAVATVAGPILHPNEALRHAPRGVVQRVLPLKNVLKDSVCGIGLNWSFLFVTSCASCSQPADGSLCVR